MVSSSRRRAPRPWAIRRLLLACIAASSSAAGSALITLKLLPDLQLTHRYAAMAASFIPYGVLAWAGAVLSILGLARGRSRALAMLPLAALTLQVSWTQPYWPRQPPAPHGEMFTVMTLNTYYGWADLQQLATEVERVRPDVVVLQEVTIQSVPGIESRQWTSLLPHHIGEPGADWAASNMMVFSRYPLSEAVQGPADAPVRVLAVQHESGPVTVVAVHTTNPVVDMSAWVSEMAEIEGVMRPGDSTPTIVIGDFNAVREHQPMQRLLQGTGLRDAAEEAGAGWLPTFPADGGVPLIGIDHVLINDRIRAVSCSSFGVERTDHRGILAQVTLLDSD